MRNLNAPIRNDIDDYRIAVGRRRPVETRDLLTGYESTIQAAYDSYADDIAAILALLPITLNPTAHLSLIRENYSALATGRALEDLAAAVHEAADFRCPSCNFEQTSTLDHFLAKSAFPEFSILSRNLVAACFNCNHKKGERPANDFVHPYFDRLPDDQILLAYTSWDPELNVSYSVAEPEGIDPELFQRLQSQFDALELADRFAREAGYILAEIMGNCVATYARGGALLVRNELLRQAVVARSAYGVNHYKTALYRALSDDEHFCNGGFQNDLANNN
jgi:hypothetical protein